MGGFRFKESLEGDFINKADSLQIPPISDVSTLAIASMEIENSEDHNQLPQKKWIQQLVQPGSSLGGARPKAVVCDAEGHLNVAKFPSRNDAYDVAIWEHHSHLLAKEAGVNAAETSVILSGGKYHTLLSKRFDRTEDGKRVHYASAMTLLGLTDGSDAQTGNGYLDIVDFILQGCTDVEKNLRELYRRVAFNIAIGNSDDHFRNHGFLLTPHGWTLSPAFDLNPTSSEYQSLLITSSSNKADLNLLLSDSEDYMIPREEASQIIQFVVDAVSKNWHRQAIRLGIAKREIDMFEAVYSNRFLQ